MEIVLGVSMTPAAVSIALVEGEKADGVIIERDVFDIDRHRRLGNVERMRSRRRRGPWYPGGRDRRRPSFGVDRGCLE